MFYLESPSTDPYFNLALEEYLFEHMDRTREYFMLWQNDNTIVVGKYQNTAEEINASYVQAHGIRVARRLSGGGAVYHDKGNLNFTFIVNQAEHSEFEFQIFAQPVLHALEHLGVHAEFNGRNDLTIDGRKFSGNSQYTKGGRLLHHGCIMLDSNLAAVADALRVKEAKFDSKSVKSVRSRVTTINEHAPRPISMEEFRSTLRTCILKHNVLEPLVLAESDLSAIQKLRDEKYATWEWNYGRSPAYHMRREKKFPAGLVTAYLQAEGERIKSVRFFGDFFGSDELSKLEYAMVSLKLDETLEQALVPLNVSHYLNGITAKDLADLLLY